MYPHLIFFNFYGELMCMLLSVFLVNSRLYFLGGTGFIFIFWVILVFFFLEGIWDSGGGESYPQKIAGINTDCSMD